MTGTMLDVSALPTEQKYYCKNGTIINLCELVAQHQPVVEAMAKAGLADYNGSLGLALAKPQQDGSFTLDQVWDDPQKFVWFVDGWGPNWQRYAGNAVRKLRPMLRVGRGSTLDLRFDHPELFQDKVDSANPDGTLPWGDFPRGGGVFECADDIILAGAVSGLKETEDDTVARLFLGSLATKIIAGDGLLSDD